MKVFKFKNPTYNLSFHAKIAFYHERYKQLTMD